MQHSACTCLASLERSEETRTESTEPAAPYRFKQLSWLSLTMSCVCSWRAGKLAYGQYPADRVEDIVVFTEVASQQRQTITASSTLHARLPQQNSQQAEASSSGQWQDQPDSAAAGNQKATMRVALVFFGITRSLTHTIDSIKQNVLQPLKDAGIEYDIYVHTYDLAQLSNDRSREHSALNTSEWQLLQPDYVSITSQVHPASLTAPCARVILHLKRLTFRGAASAAVLL